jgi:hypothetical protein
MCDSPDCRHPQQKQRARRSRNWSGPFRKTPGRLLGMGSVRLYQLTLSGFIGNSCRHIPTCSEYGYEAIGRMDNPVPRRPLRAGRKRRTGSRPQPS